MSGASVLSVVTEVAETKLNWQVMHVLRFVQSNLSLLQHRYIVGAVTDSQRHGHRLHTLAHHLHEISLGHNRAYRRMKRGDVDRPTCHYEHSRN